MSFSSYEADVCKTEGIRCCFGAVSLCCLTGYIWLLFLLVDVFVNLKIIAECTSGFILRIMPSRKDPGSTGVEDAVVWEQHLYVLLLCWRNSKRLMWLNRSTWKIALLRFPVLHMSLYSALLCTWSHRLLAHPFRGHCWMVGEREATYKLHSGAPNAHVHLQTCVKVELISKTH